MALVNITKNPFSEPISVRFGNNTPTKNGAFVTITKDKAETEKDVFKADAFGDGKKPELEIAVIAESFHPYQNENEDDLVIEQNKVYRAFPIKHGLEIAVSQEDFIHNTVDVGDAVKPHPSSHKLVKDTEGTSAIGYVIGTPVLNGQKSVEIRFI